MTWDGFSNYYYDAENRLIQVNGTLGTCSTATACYVYDANGQRVRSSQGTGGSEWVRDLQGHIVSQEIIGSGLGDAHIYLGSQEIAEYAGGTTYFHQPDHLGSTRLVTKMDQSVCESMDYVPFGQPLAFSTSCSMMNLFTGDQWDSETGLDDTLFRKYSWQLSRWMTPDPAGPAFANLSVPQSFNLYSYVLNNPLRFTDPTGLYCYYGDTGDDGWSIADFSSPENFDFQSSTKECEDTGGSWHDLATDHQEFTVTDTPMDPPNGLVQSIRDFVDAWSTGPTEGKIIRQVNQCAAKKAVSLASLAGWDENNPFVSSFAGNDASALSNAVFGPGRGQATAGLVTSNPVKSVVADTMIDLAGQIPMGGTIYTATGRSVMTPYGAAIDMTAASKTLADVVPKAVPKAGATALKAFTKFKLVFDASAYLNALWNCANP